MKKNLRILIITSVVTVLPILVGIVLWSKLPDRIPTHWNIAGEVDGWSSKAFAVFGMPLMMLAFQWICGFALSADPKKQNQPKRMLQASFWIIPVISVALMGIMYATALGRGINVNTVLPVLTGLLFAIIGNYMPKCKHNYTMGIRLPWTLNSEENWNRTHRLGGWVWMIGGIAIMLVGLLAGTIMMGVIVGITLLMALIPMVYSYVLYRKGI